MLAIWLAHIWLTFFFMPIAYELTGSFNLAFCANPALRSKRDHGFRKKVKLNSFGKKFFCGYDTQGNMLWQMLLFQSLFLVYICAFILLNIIFVITLVTSNANPTSWIKLWIFEIVAQHVLLAIAMISSWVKNIFLWSNERKNKEHSKDYSSNMISRDREILKYKKIIKLKGKIVTFLKHYGLRTDNRQQYVIYFDDVTRIEKKLSKKFPKLYTTILKTQYGIHFFNIYDSLNNLLIQIRII